MARLQVFDPRRGVVVDEEDASGDGGDGFAVMENQVPEDLGSTRLMECYRRHLRSDIWRCLDVCCSELF
jgi:hypothetical protein